MSAQHAELAFEITRDALLVVEGGKLVHANAAARAMLTEDGRGDPHGWVRPTDARAWRKALEQGRGEVEVSLECGTPVSARLTALSDGATLVELHDLSARRALEARVVDEDHMRAVGHMATGIAHDMNNVLTVVASIGSVMRNDMRDNSTALEDIEDIMTAAKAGQELTANLLGFARHRAAARDHLDAGQIAIEIVELLRRTVPAMTRMNVSVDPNVIIEADRSRLSQALTNLMLNAVDAFRGDGCIEVRVERVERDTDPRRPETRPAGSYAHIRVADNGPGMDEATRDRCFEPFFTTKDPGQGTGLGLSMVRDTATKHHGWVDLETSPGHGTSFDLYLPAVPVRQAMPVPVNVAPATLMTPSLTPDSRGHRGRVLVVDDEKPIRRVARRLLRQLGYDPVSAVDGPAAVELFERAPESFTAVVCDVVMPIMDGPEVCRRLRALRPDLRVLVCSGHADYDYRLEFGDGPRTRFMPKPFDFDSLAASLDALLNDE